MKEVYATILIFLALVITLPLPVSFFDSNPIYFLSCFKLLLTVKSHFLSFGLIGNVILLIYIIVYLILCACLAVLLVKKLIPDDPTKRTAFTGLFILSLFIGVSSFNCYTLLSGASVNFLSLY